MLILLYTDPFLFNSTANQEQINKIYKSREKVPVKQPREGSNVSMIKNETLSTTGQKYTRRDEHY